MSWDDSRTRPNTNKSIFPLVLCSFTLFSSCRGIIAKSHKSRFYPALQKKRAISERGKNERQNLSIGRTGGGLRMREKEDIYHLPGPIETAGWSIFHFNCQCYLQKICPRQTGYSKKQPLRYSFVPFKWGSIERQPCDINTNTAMLHFGNRNTNSATQQIMMLHSLPASYCVVKCRVDAGIWVQTGFVVCQAGHAVLSPIRD